MDILYFPSSNMNTYSIRFLAKIFSYTLILLAALNIRSSSRQYFVSPFGSSSADGTRAQPWDLQTALNGASGVIAAGDTINLMGGTYVGIFSCTLIGTEANPILIRSNPGAWARIDGNKTTTLAQPITASSRTITLSDASGFLPYCFVHVGAINSDSIGGVEDMRLDTRTGNTFTNCQRGWNGTKPITHEAGETVTLTGSGVLTITGSDLVFRDLEIFNSNPLRVFKYYVFGSGKGIGSRPEGFSVRGARVKIINCTIHDNGDGIGFWQQAIDSEVYGCLIYNNGHSDSLRGHGHGLYIQNQTGTKKITDVVSFNNFAMGMKAFGEAGPAVGVEFRGVLSFNNGSPSAFTGNPSGFAPSHRYSNLFVGTSQVPADRIVVDSCYAFHPLSTSSEYGAMAFGYTQSNDSLRVTNSYIVGSQAPFGIKGWKQATVANNTIVATMNPSSQLVQVENVPSGAKYNWNHNSYYDDTPVRNCYDGNRRAPFFFPAVYSSCNRAVGGPLSFGEWKSGSGFDANSAYNEWRPSIIKMIVRPNQYAKARGHIIVFNWSNIITVYPDISKCGFEVNDVVEVIDVQKFGAVIAIGVYSGSTIEFNVDLGGVTPPIGLPFELKHTAPLFNVFLIRKKQSPTLISNGNTTPDRVKSLSVHPQPVTRTAEFKIRRETEDLVSLHVFNQVGKRVATLHHGNLHAGHHRFTWDMQLLPAGMYYGVLLSGTTREIVPVVKIR